MGISAVSVLEHRKINLYHRIEVADQSGEIAFKVEFGDVITVES